MKLKSVYVKACVICQSDHKVGVTICPKHLKTTGRLFRTALLVTRATQMMKKYGRMKTTYQG